MDTQTPNQEPVQNPIQAQPVEQQTNAPAPEQLESGVSLLKRSWEIFQHNINLLGGLAAAAAIVQIAFVVIMPSDTANSEVVNPGTLGLGLVVGLISALIAFIVSVMMTVFALRRHEVWTANSLFNASLSKLAPLVWISFLTGIAVFLGFICLIIPGIYLGVALSFGMYIVIDQNITGTAALNLSREYVKGLWWPIFLRFLLLAVVFIVPAFVVGLFFGQNPMASGVLNAVINGILTPVATIYGALLYEQLKKIKTTGV